MHGLHDAGWTWLAALLGLLLLAGGATGGLHHHDDLGSHRNCAVCVAAHAPALAATTIQAPPPPRPTPWAVAAPQAVQPRCVADNIPLGRAPPA